MSAKTSNRSSVGMRGRVVRFPEYLTKVTAVSLLAVSVLIVATTLLPAVGILSGQFSVYTPLFVDIIIGSIAGLFVVLNTLLAIAVWKGKRWTVFVLHVAAVFVVVVSIVAFLRSHLLFVLAWSLVSLLLVVTTFLLRNAQYSMYGNVSKKLYQYPLLVTYLLATIVVVWPTFVSDESDVIDSDLVLVPVEILSETDNSYYLLQTVTNFGSNEREVIDGALDNLRVDSEAAAVVTSTKTISNTWNEAAQLTGYQCPSTVNRFDMTAVPCTLGILTDLARLELLHGLSALQAGNTNSWVDSLRSNMLIARQLHSQHTTGGWLEMSISAAIYQETVQHIASVLGQDVIATPNPELQTLLQEMTLPEDWPIDFLRAEYMQYSNLVQDVAQQAGLDDERSTSYRFLPNQTQNYFAKNFRARIEASTTCPPSIVAWPQAIERIHRLSADSLIQSLFVPNIVGRTIYVVGAYHGEVPDTHCQLNRQINELLQKIN